jgi:uncharacterized protein (TIGR02145 family)
MKKFFFFFIGLLATNASFAQNVGIGTSTPTAKLQVNGTFRLYDGSQAPGRVLTSNDIGLASWQALPSPPPPPPPPVNYPVVWICCNPWTIKNLDVSTYRNGDVIPKVTDAATWAALTTGAYCYYDNDSSTYAATYGKLYNWYAVNDPRGLAPEGWHVPSDFEWTTLGTCLGGDDVAGGLIKEIDTTHWSTPNTGATNVSGFTALPGGLRTINGTFNSIGLFAYWWSSTETDINEIWYRRQFHSSVMLTRFDSLKGYGFSVRCLRD